MLKSEPLQQLLGILGTLDFEENGRMRVVSVRWSADRLAVRFHVDHGTEETSTWQLRFTGVLEHLFTDVVNECGLNIWDGDHPAIDQYVQPREFLHFASAPQDPHHVVGELWAAHVKLVDDWIPFERYFNGEVALHQLLASGSGLLAKGPVFLLSAYASILENAGCRPTRQALPPARLVQTATLTHFGESYVVAEKVIVRKLAA